MNLYEITEEDRKLNQLLETIETEEDYEIATDLMQEVTMQLEKKSSGIIKYTKGLEGLEKSIDDEIKRLQANKKAVKNRKDKFKKYVLDCLLRMGVNKVETPLGTLGVRKSPASVLVEDEESIPAKYVVIKQVYQVDKKLIKEDIKKGVEIEGVVLVEDNKTLSIK